MRSSWCCCSIACTGPQTKKLNGCGSLARPTNPIAAIPMMNRNIMRLLARADRIDITLDQDRVREHLDEATRNAEPKEKAQSEADRPMITLSIPARLKRTGKEMRIIVSDGSEPATLTLASCVFSSGPTQSGISFSGIGA